MTNDKSPSGRDRLAGFVEARGGIGLSDVAVSAPQLGDWPSGTPIHRVDALWIDTGSPGTVDEADEVDMNELVGSYSTYVLSPRGYTDRTALGMLITGREMLSRGVPEHRLLGCIALTDRPSWTDAVYHENGIEVAYSDPGFTRPKRPPRPGRAGAKSYEDDLLLRYFEDAKGSTGPLWQEVPVADRRIDGVHIDTTDLDQRPREWSDEARIGELVEDHDVEIIEVKGHLNTDVIGQVIAGTSLFRRKHPNHRLIRETIVVEDDPDSALLWVCNRRGIQVYQASRSSGPSSR